MSNVALTFDGNPYSPITQYDDWYAFDPIKAEMCNRILARECPQNTELPPEVDNYFLEQAIDYICDLNITGYFKKHVEKE